MTADREQDLQNTIIRQGNEIKALEAKVRRQQADLDHAVADATRKVASFLADLSEDAAVCRRVLVALNAKMRLLDDDELKGDADGRRKPAPAAQDQDPGKDGGDGNPTS